MRDIKFRGMIKGKHTENSNWVYGYITRSPKRNWMEVAEENGYLYFIQHRDFTSTQVELKTLGEYTGLKDRNSREIYEGDIVRAKANSTFNEYSTISDVIREENGQWSVRSIGYNHGLSLAWGGWKSIEVIGNIWENPELLEK